MSEEQGLARQEGGLPTPAYTGDQMAAALKAYKTLQRTLDESMPDQLMTIGYGTNAKVFRKKGFWRAVNVAFNLSVEVVLEERCVAGSFEDGRENFGYNVTYKATHPSGRSAIGDGASYAVEKAPKFRCPHPQKNNANRTEHFPAERCPDFDPNSRWARLPDQATEHNVRSHAHTRAFNRAVSNLCGFGEVSAEEMTREDIIEAETVNGDPHREPQLRPQEPQVRSEHPATRNELPEDGSQDMVDSPRQHPTQRQADRGRTNAGSGGGATITPAQDRRYFALAMKAGWEGKVTELKQALKDEWGFTNSKDIPMSQYNKIIEWVQRGPQ